MIQFEINGNTFADPQNWQDVTERSYFSPEVLGYLYEVNGTLIFYGEAYNYLRSVYFSDGCAVVPCVLTIDNRKINVNIFLNDAVWRLRTCNVEVEFVENTYTSYISNNKDIKAYLNVPRSKNDNDITAFTTVQIDCEFKEYQIGVGSPATGRHGVRLYDALKFIIAFISDGEMDFESDYLAKESDPLNPSSNRNPTLFDPKELRVGGGIAFPYISFQELINDTYSEYNINFRIEPQINGRPLFRVEQPEYFKSNNVGITLSDPNEIKQQSDVSKFYQLVKIGSSEVLDSHLYYDPIQLFSWDREEYHLGGTCNNDSILDLELKKIITDTNIIQDALPIATGGTENESYDGDVVMVVLDGDNVTVVAENPVNAAFQNYNALLKNDEVLNRFYGDIPQSIFLFLGEGQNDSRREIQTATPITSATIVNNPVFNITGIYAQFTGFPIETSDPNNNMSIDPATYQFYGLNQSNITIYTAPVSGVYDVNFEVKAAGIDFAQQNGAVYLAVYDTDLTTPLNLFPFGYAFNAENYLIPILQGRGFGGSQRGGITGDSSYSLCNGSQTMFLNAGDKVTLITTFRFNPTVDVQYIGVSYFEVFDNLTITKTSDPAASYLIKTSIETFIDCNTWDTYMQDKNAEILITGNEHSIKGYVNDIERNATTGEATVSILGKFANSL